MLSPIDSTVNAASGGADGGQPSARTPLRNRVFRNLFIAQFASNIGTWMQSVAAQWFLVEKHSTAVIVALVQTASLGPTLLLGLFAGVLADLFNRRRLLMFLQSYAVLVGASPGSADIPRSPWPGITVDVYLGHWLRFCVNRAGLAGDSARGCPARADTGRRDFGQCLGKRRPCNWTGDWRRCRGVGRTRSGLRDQRSIVCGDNRCPGGLETTKAKRADGTRTPRPGHHHRTAIRS